MHGPLDIFSQSAKVGVGGGAGLLGDARGFGRELLHGLFSSGFGVFGKGGADGHVAFELGAFRDAEGGGAEVGRDAGGGGEAAGLGQGDGAAEGAMDLEGGAAEVAEKGAGGGKFEGIGGDDQAFDGAGNAGGACEVQFAFDAGVGGDDGELEVFRHNDILMGLRGPRGLLTYRLSTGARVELEQGSGRSIRR